MGLSEKLLVEYQAVASRKGKTPGRLSYSIPHQKLVLADMEFVIFRLYCSRAEYSNSGICISLRGCGIRHTPAGS